MCTYTQHSHIPNTVARASKERERKKAGTRSVRSVVDAYTSHVARKEKRSDLMRERGGGEAGYERKGRKGATFKKSGTLLRAREPPASLDFLFALTTFARIDFRRARARAYVQREKEDTTVV